MRVAFTSAFLVCCIVDENTNRNANCLRTRLEVQIRRSTVPLLGRCICDTSVVKCLPLAPGKWEYLFYLCRLECSWRRCLQQMAGVGMLHRGDEGVCRSETGVIWLCGSEMGVMKGCAAVKYGHLGVMWRWCKGAAWWTKPFVVVRVVMWFSM